MQEQSIFVSDDGSRFETAEDALLWDEIYARVKELKDEDLSGQNVLPEGLQEVSGDTREYLEGFLASYRQRQDLFAQEGLESRWLLERLKTFNYLTNYIFYGSANPCKP